MALRTATLVVRKSTDSSWYWRFKSANGKIQAHGRGYNRKRDAYRGFDDLCSVLKTKSYEVKR